MTIKIINTAFFKLSRVEIAALIFLGLILFWNLGSYPAWFDHIVPASIWPQVNHVLDGQPYPSRGLARWQWQDMYQHNAGLSPIYGFFIETGLKLYGLTLLAVRLPQTGLAFFVFIFAYLVLRHFSNYQFALLSALSLGTSPWFLVMIRSGGIIGFGCIQLIMTGSLLALMFSKRVEIPFRWALILAVISGISVALLPYSHTSTRLFALLFALIIPLSFKKVGIANAIAFTFTVLLIFSIQFMDIQHAKAVYFNARGEGLFQVAAGQTEISYAEFVKNKLIDNLIVLSKLLLSLNNPTGFFSDNLASSYWNPEVVLYPKWLVPLFLLGLPLCLHAVIARRSYAHGLLLLLLAISCIPSLMSGYGSPNQARLFIAVIPIYLLIAIGANWLYQRWLGKLQYGQIIGTCMLGFFVLFQAHNFFFYEKGELDEKKSYRSMMKTFDEMQMLCPNATFVLNEFPDFDVYSYVMIRWLGGDKLAEQIKQQKVWLFNYQTSDSIRQMLPTQSQLVLISAKGSADKLIQALSIDLPPVLNNTSDDLLIFARNCP